MSQYSDKKEIEPDRNRDWVTAGLTVDASASAKVEQVSTCPSCSASRRYHKRQRCVSVNVEKGLWFCSHCGAKGYVPSFKELAERSKREQRIDEQRNQQPVQKDYKRPQWKPDFLFGNLVDIEEDEQGNYLGASPRASLAPDQRKVVEYLLNERRLSAEVLHRCKVTVPYQEVPRRQATDEYDENGKRKQITVKELVPVVYFNYFDRGVYINYKLRQAPSKAMWFFAGGEVIPYNIDSILRKEVCYITEGEIDALSLVQAGFPETVSAPTGGSNTNLTWLDRFVETHFMDKRTVYLCLDNDEVGRKLLRELVRRLGTSRCRVVHWDEGCKDANDELRQHGVEGIRRCVERSEPLPMYGIQTAHTTEVEQSLDQMFRYGMGQGAEVRMGCMDKQLTYETGRFMVVTGRPGDGKSEVVDEICLRLCLLHGWRIAFFSPENVPLHYHLAKMISKLTGYEFRENGRMSARLYATCKDWLDANVCHIMPGGDGSLDNILGCDTVRLAENLRPDLGEPEAFTLDEVLAVAREAVQRRGVRICVFDPLNSFRRGEQQASLTDLQWYLHVCNTLLGFAHANDVLVILVAHPRKVDRSLMDNRQRRVEMNDISGSSDIANKCDFCVCVDRDDDLKVVTLYVDKVKFKHLGNRGKVTLHYDVVSGRYVPCTLQRLSEPDALCMRSQPLDAGQELLTAGNQTYLKTVDWHYFNIRWLNEQGRSNLLEVPSVMR